jgi:hypothetical protein
MRFLVQGQAHTPLAKNVLRLFSLVPPATHLGQADLPRRLQHLFDFILVHAMLMNMRFTSDRVEIEAKVHPVLIIPPWDRPVEFSGSLKNRFKIVVDLPSSLLPKASPQGAYMAAG